MRAHHGWTHATADTIKNPVWQATWVGSRFQHSTRRGADRHGFGKPLRPEAAIATSDDATSGRVPHVERVLPVEFLRQLRKIVGVDVRVVAVPGLHDGWAAQMLFGGQHGYRVIGHGCRSHGRSRLQL